MIRTFVLLLSGMWAMAWAQASTNFERRLAVDPHGTVEITNVSGKIDVRGWDRSEVEVRGDVGSGVQRVDVTTDHGRTDVRVIAPNHAGGGIDTDLHIRVPHDSQLEISTVTAEVEIAEVEGAQMLRSVSGTIKSEIYEKNAEIKTVSGDVVVRGHRKDTSMHITTISGNIRIDRAAGDLDATTVSGDMTVRLDPSRNVRVRTTSGDLGFEGRLAKGASLNAETVSGDLTVRAIPEAGIVYEVGTFSGDIKDCMGVEAERVSRYAPGKRLTGSQGAAGPDESQVRLKTMSGDVELCDKS